MPVAEPRESAELTEAEVLEVVRERLRDAYGMTIDEYIEARKAGQLPRTPAAASLEMLLGGLCSPEFSAPSED